MPALEGWSKCWVLCLKGFFLICFLNLGILREVSGQDLNRIFISFPGVSFDMLMPQNEAIEGSRSFSG